MPFIMHSYLPISLYIWLPVTPFHAEYLLSLIAGGGTALSINNLTGMLRIKTTASSFGLANSSYSTMENILCIGFIVLAYLIPILFGIFIIILAILSYRVMRNLVRKYFNFI